MCGRFTQAYTWTEVHAFLSVFGAAQNLRPRYNIAPTTMVDVVRLDAEGRRCVIPASGFFEWTGEKGDKTPHLFTAADGAPVLAFAGLWDRWRDPATGDELLSCTIVVSGASEWMAPYHDRMPVLLGAGDIEGWLDGSLGTEALRPAAESALREWVVSNRVNRTGFGDDDPTIIEPVAQAG
jgi:putative SOS response-associated peptidase YedK